LSSALQRSPGGRRSSRRSRRSGRRTEVAEVTVPHATVPPGIDMSILTGIPWPSMWPHPAPHGS
jgi:hypothetical protein